MRGECGKEEARHMSRANNSPGTDYALAQCVLGSIRIFFALFLGSNILLQNIIDSDRLPFHYRPLALRRSIVANSDSV